jgi:hypothetical protein
MVPGETCLGADYRPFIRIYHASNVHNSTRWLDPGATSPCAWTGEIINGEADFIIETDIQGADTRATVSNINESARLSR